MPIAKVLVANRGEIAVRVIRAARDAGIGSVAIYADPDTDSMFVKLADDAFALNGMTPAETYLNIPKILDIAARAGADAVHPGYGFLAENAAFAQAVIDAGLTWIGPPPAAIDALGDKVQARHIAARVGAPLVPGTADPVKDADLIRDASPVEHAKQIHAPLLMAFGGNDVRVPLNHGTLMRDALRDAGQKPEFVVYDGEGHGFLKLENRVDFYTRVEKFLATNLK